MRMSVLGKKSQAARRARRLAAIDPEQLAEILTATPRCDGTPIGCLQYQSFLTGQVTRWTVLCGPRINNYRLRTPDSRTSKPHGLSWLLNKIRHVLLQRL